MSSIFTKIVNGEIPAYKIAEDDRYLAFLDVNPNAKGHTLCIPKQEINKIFDMEEDHYLGLMQFSRKVAKAIENGVTRWLDTAVANEQRFLLMFSAGIQWVLRRFGVGAV